MELEFVLLMASGFCNVFGAIIIALPDTPRLRLILWSERVREGMYEMEANGLTKEKVGFKEMEILLKDIYGTELPSGTWGYRSGFHTLSRYGFEDIYLFTDPMDGEKQMPLGKELGNELDYRSARSTIKHRINNYQASVRATGFLLLALGFGIQAIRYIS